MRRLAVPALLSCAVLLAACGGSEEADVVNDAPDTSAAAADSSADDLSQDGEESGGSETASAPEFMLTGAVDAPAGWTLDTANCPGNDESGPPFFDYHVPPNWQVSGSGYSGGGGAGGTGTHDYSTGERLGDQVVQIKVAEEGYLDGQPIGDDGQTPWSSWDYEVTTFGDDGDVTESIGYTELDPIEIDGTSHELWFLDQGQSEQVSRSEYKLRLVFAMVPTRSMTGGYATEPASAAVSVSWDEESTELSEDEVRQVLSTFRLAECSQEAITTQLEMILGVEFSD